MTLQPAQLTWKVCNWFALIHSWTQTALRTTFAFLPPYNLKRFCPDGLWGSTKGQDDQYYYRSHENGDTDQEGMRRHCILLTQHRHASEDRNKTNAHTEQNNSGHPEGI